MNPLGTTLISTPHASRSAAPADTPTTARPASASGRRALLSATSLVVLAAGWWLLAHSGRVPALFLPSPEAVWEKFVLTATHGFMDATLWQHLAASLSRILLGLAAAVVIGVPLGVLTGANGTARALLDPLIEAWRPVPPLAYLPLIVIWFGIGELSKVLLIFLAILAPVIIATAHGVAHVDRERLRAAQTLGANRRQLMLHVVLPEALPEILTGIRIGLGTGWSTLVAAELVAATRGLGFMVQSAAQFLVTDIVVLGILVIAIVAFALEASLRLLQRTLSPWYRQND
jgi:taurine transport system permease protein